MNTTQTMIVDTINQTILDIPNFFGKSNEATIAVLKLNEILTLLQGIDSNG